MIMWDLGRILTSGFAVTQIAKFLNRIYLEMVLVDFVLIR